ncbi:MAG TPA: acyltransferase [Bryobacteraceae bacterium]|nr:acyltransferase [Bryobacteraceae bacterium]
MPTNPQSANNERLPALTGCRFVLALWVMLHHLTNPGQALEPAAQALPPGLYALIRAGYMAVATFFVLSGFVLTRSYARTPWTGENLARYLVGRLARVYPVYLLSLAVVAPIILADPTPGRGFFAGAYALLLQGWLGRLPMNWNTPAWSLSCEMFFYFTFPLAAAFLARATWRSTLLVAAGACCLTRALWAVGVSDDIKPLIHLSDFLMGIAAACAYDLLSKSRRRPSGWWLYVPGCAAGAALLANPSLLPRGLDLNTALRPLNALAQIGLGLGGGYLARLLSTRVVVYLGKSSYAMYILHVPILWWYRRWTHSFSPWLYVAAVIAISALVYGVFEEPANRYLRRMWGQSPNRLSAMGHQPSA